MKVSRIIEALGIGPDEVSGDQNRVIRGAAALAEARQGNLTFCKRDREPRLAELKDCTIIIPWTMNRKNLSKENTYLLTGHPRLLFIRALELLYPEIFQPGADKLARIHPSARIDPSARIGPFVQIGPGCVIKKNATIHSHVSILLNTTIAENVLIFPGTVIGSDGFGYERDAKKKLRKFIHLKGVVIGKNVEIGANTCIDRGSLTDTEIGESTKIDNLVHIAHNVKIGKHCEIIAHAMIGGSARIGDYTRVAPGAQIMNGIKIGRNVTIGMGAVVTRDVGDNLVMAGNPAREMREFKKYLEYIKAKTSRPKKVNKSEPK